MPWVPSKDAPQPTPKSGWKPVEQSASAPSGAPPMKKGALATAWDDFKEAPVGAGKKIYSDLKRQAFTEGKADVPQLAGDIAGVLSSPLAGIQHAVLRPATEAIAKRVPVYDSNPFAYLSGGPRKLSQAEAAKKLEGDIGMALMGARAPAALRSTVPVPRSPPAPPPSTASAAVRKMARMAPQDAPRLVDRVTEMRSVGMNPTLADALDDSGAGILRAAASRQTPARQAARDFADGRRLGLQDRVGIQARRTVSNDPRTPMQIAEELGQARATQAANQFGAVRAETFDLAPETVQSLRSEHGRAGIREAAARERDPEVRAALNRLADDVLDNPGGTQISIGMADRISRSLLGRAQAAARAGDNDLAATLTGLGTDIRGPARTAVPGYDEALNNYEAQSRLMESAGRGEDFLARNTDEFAADVGRMGPDELALAQATARRAIERAAGENPGAAPGVARRIAHANEQQARNEALLGPDRARELERSLAIEEQAVQRGNLVDPGTGSRTQLNQADQAATQGMEAVARVGANLAHGNVLGLGMDAAKLALRRMRFSDAEAEELIGIALDPARTDEAIAFITPRVGNSQQRAGAILSNIRAGAANLAVPINDAQEAINQPKQQKPLPPPPLLPGR